MATWQWPLKKVTPINRFSPINRRGVGNLPKGTVIALFIEQNLFIGFALFIGLNLFIDVPFLNGHCQSAMPHQKWANGKTAINRFSPINRRGVGNLPKGNVIALFIEQNLFIDLAL